MQENLTKAKHFEQHEEISNITNQLEQIQHNKQLGAQIRSRLPPLTSIDNTSPLASVTANLIQSKSLLSIDSNTSYSSSIKKNVSNNFSSYLSFFKNLWNPITTHLNSLIYLDKIFTSKSNDILQTLQPSSLITQNEIRAAIQTLNINSAHDLNGYTPSLYTSFPLLTPILCQTFNNIYLQKKVTCSQSHALIKLIPKTPKPTSVKNWRPISLFLILIIKFYLLLFLPDSNLFLTL